MSATPSPFLALPRELRDQIYDHVFSTPDTRSERARRIERRNVRHFVPSPAAILLLLHHDALLLNRQVAAEALEVLFKRHSVLLSCGPFVLKTLLEKIEGEGGGGGKEWLRWLKRVEVDWVTFPNLKLYPPSRGDARGGEWEWGGDEGMDVDHMRGALYSGHYDEHDCEGEAYDDNIYAPDDPSLYPVFDAAPRDYDPSFLFPRPSDYDRHLEWPVADEAPIESKLATLVALEVIPLFTYLRTPTFALSSITLPLYFLSKQTYQQRHASHHGHTLPLKLRYWVHVAVCALAMLIQPRAESAPPLDEVRIKYMPWDIWAAMDPSDDLAGLQDGGVWFDAESDSESGAGGLGREGEGAAFRSIWAGLADMGVRAPRRDVRVQVRFVAWEGDLDRGIVGDWVDVVFSRA